LPPLNLAPTSVPFSDGQEDASFTETSLLNETNALLSVSPTPQPTFGLMFPPTADLPSSPSSQSPTVLPSGIPTTAPSEALSRGPVAPTLLPTFRFLVPTLSSTGSPSIQKIATVEPVQVLSPDSSNNETVPIFQQAGSEDNQPVFMFNASAGLTPEMSSEDCSTTITIPDPIDPIPQPVSTPTNVPISASTPAPSQIPVIYQASNGSFSETPNTTNPMEVAETEPETVTDERATCEPAWAYCLAGQHV
jgi:hypothetical protein